MSYLIFTISSGSLCLMGLLTFLLARSKDDKRELWLVVTHFFPSLLLLIMAIMAGIFWYDGISPIGLLLITGWIVFGIMALLMFLCVVVHLIVYLETISYEKYGLFSICSKCGHDDGDSGACTLCGAAMNSFMGVRTTVFHRPSTWLRKNRYRDLKRSC